MGIQKTHCSAAASAAALAVATALTAAATPAGAAPRTPPTGTTHVVRPGETIQQAVDAARPGDTVLVPAGVFRGSVRITVPHLTLRGTGPATVIAPGTGGAAGGSAAGTDAAAASAAGPPTAATCAAAGNGICVTGTAQRRVAGVTISSLAVVGFLKNGVWGSETDAMTVRDVLAENNGQHGLGQEKSVGGRFTGNASLDNAESGIFLANTVTEEGGALDTQGALVARNLLSGNRIGVTVRRLRDLTVERNDVTGNCGGVFLVGDENLPRAGALTVSRNRVAANNKYCPASGRLPFIQGAGIVLTGVENTLVARNDVLDNAGGSPMSGGIVLFPSVVGTPNTANRIDRNLALGNKPADVADRDTKGTANAFTANRLLTAEPAGLSDGVTS